jgi:stage IV sporulation protein FB
MFGMPTATRYDWNFRLLGIPVRVSPWFWLTAILLNARDDPRNIILWVGCVLVSILVHEYGHGLTARAFGYRSQIALFGLGGLCASEAERQTFGQRLAVLAMGPGAQFLFLALLMLTAGPTFGLTWQGNLGLAKLLLGVPVGRDEAMNLLPFFTRLQGEDSIAAHVYWYLFQINFFWPLLNLLPLWPLDGGQITVEVLGRVNRRDGRRWGHIVSMLTAGGLAVYTLVQMQSEDDPGNKLFRVIFFGFFAFTNYQVLEAYQKRYMTYGPDEDPDWWTR